MIATMKEEWRLLRRGRPGHRFKDRYAASRRARDKTTLLARLVRIIIAVLALAIGVVLMFIPGPAILFFFIAGSLLATESRGVARFLDWIEVRLRLIAKRAVGIWRQLPLAGKFVVVVIVLLGAAAAAYIAYRLLVA